jgi:hypothetical protein
MWGIEARLMGALCRISGMVQGCVILAAMSVSGSIEGQRVRVRNLEALDGTPIIRLKPVLGVDVVER